MNNSKTAIDGTAKKTIFSEYEIQANSFSKKHDIRLKINSVKYGRHFEDDKDSRYIFNCTLSMVNRQYTFNFGQSISAGNTQPTMYDVLTCLQKYDIGTFEDFCSEFGYDEDSRKAERIYKAVCKEYEGMLRVFGTDILEEMQEIQ